MSLWNPHLEVFLPTLIQGCEKNLFVEGYLFFHGGSQNHQPPLLERRRGERRTICFPGSLVRAPQNKTLLGGSNQVGLALNGGCTLSSFRGQGTPGRKLVAHGRLRSGPTTTPAALTANTNTTALPWTPFSPPEKPEAKIKQLKLLLEASTLNGNQIK